MVKKYSLTFRPVETPLDDFRTKFGGQPTWMAGPQWPLSRATGEPMRFICQVAIDPLLFGNAPSSVAYLFITDGETFVDNTWDAEGGENALVVQPGHYDGPMLLLREGPTLQTWLADEGERRPVQIEYAVELVPGEAPDVLDEDKARAEGDGAWQEYTSRWSDIKLGGTPAFLQEEKYPLGGPWRLLLQLDSEGVPFELNFGDAGIGYAFLSADGSHGKFLWQSL
jgi:hypothetical protein